MVNADFALNPVTGKDSKAWVLNWIYPKMLITAYIYVPGWAVVNPYQLVSNCFTTKRVLSFLLVS